MPTKQEIIEHHEQMLMRMVGRIETRIDLLEQDITELKQAIKRKKEGRGELRYSMSLNERASRVDEELVRVCAVQELLSDLERGD